ncbi:MAG: peptidoglycan DD-metalloendopeptidase family protein [Sneathiella sp.]|nr:peptidoglycan DD-metalloendopeptidase family protein [Sneathiella sp.]
MPHPDKHSSTHFLAIRIAVRTLCLIAVLTTTFPAVANPDIELRKLRQALTASSERQEEISARLQLLSGEIKALKEKSVTVAKRLVNIDRKMLKTEERLADIQNVEQQTLATLAEQNEGLADTLSALLQLSRQPEGSLVGSPDNLINKLRTAILLKAAVAALKEDADTLTDQLETLATLRDQFLAEKKSFQDLQASRMSEQKTLNSLLISKRSAQSSLAGRNSKEATEQRKLSIEARDLVALINTLETRKQVRLKDERVRIEREIIRQEKLRQAEINRKKEEEIQQAKEAARDQKNKETRIAAIPKPRPSRKSDTAQNAVAPAPKPDQLAALNLRKSFSKAKGTLALPVGGRIISQYNASREIGKRNGIVIETRGNAAVVSPYDGQIAFAGPFRQYGLLLIIDHGEGYHTLLAGMGSIEGSVGQLLLAGEPVGQMKSSTSVKPTLYMELRVKGSTINPTPWLAAENRKVSG